MFMKCELFLNKAVIFKKWIINIMNQAFHFTFLSLKIGYRNLNF